MAHSHEFIGWPTLLAKILDRQDLDSSQAESAIEQILNGSATPSQMTAFVVAMRAKG